MERFSCSLCLKPYGTAEVLSVLIPLTEAGSMREIVICQDCTTAILPALQVFAAGGREDDQELQ